MCLYEEAHGVDASHPIFRAPFAVTPTLVEQPTPEHYLKADPALGATLPKWRVHKDKIGPYVGVVADGYGFGDSPDCEWISSGRNSKNARAAALARQGNFFQWGFSAAPSAMTDEAQKVFLNTLVYMRGFAGKPPLETGDGRSRQWLPVYVGYLGSSSASFARNMLPPSWTAGDATPDIVRQRLVAELGFVRRDGSKFVVDDDCKALGLGNDDPGFLAHCVDLLSDATHAERAAKLLQRYSGEAFAEPQQWRQWLQETDGRRWFSDRAGQWRVAPAGYPAPHRPH